MTKKQTPTTLGLQPTFGFGDRLGSATPGHVEALRREGGAIRGVFAQQSIREMQRTGRSPAEVLAAAADALAAEGFQDDWGADADHLKTPADVDATAQAGFLFFTIDPSDFVDQHADDYDPDSLQTRFAEISAEIDWPRLYEGRTVAVGGGPVITFDPQTVRRAAVKYGRALQHALGMSDHIQEISAKRGQPYEIELSVDETAQPTTLAEHYIIADQCRRHGAKLTSLAPRLVGSFEKGVDFKGYRDSLQRSLEDHAAIARQFGPYKLSLHSGSDKLSMYGGLARATGGLYHVKTAGTSYLEALRVAAIHAPDVFREIVQFARTRYDADRATYHVSAEVSRLPAATDVLDDKELERLYLECWEDVPEGQGFTQPGRQILHCTFGSVLSDARLGPLVRQIVREHAETYREVLADHFGRHLRALQAG